MKPVCWYIDVVALVESSIGFGLFLLCLGWVIYKAYSEAIYEEKEKEKK